MPIIPINNNINFFQPISLNNINVIQEKFSGNLLENFSNDVNYNSNINNFNNNEQSLLVNNNINDLNQILENIKLVQNLIYIEEINKKKMLEDQFITALRGFISLSGNN